jgi:hypothetical protein
MTFAQAGLALGRGTILAEFERKGRAAGGLAFDGKEARILSLLTAAYREPLAGGVIEKIRHAGEYWRAGDKALAQIHLAFPGLPKIDEVDAPPLPRRDCARKRRQPKRFDKGLGVSARGAGHRKIQSRSAACASRERSRERGMDHRGRGKWRECLAAQAPNHHVRRQSTQYRGGSTIRAGVSNSGHKSEDDDKNP